MTKAEIERYLSELNAELFMMNLKGEICLYGGAAMCLAFNARPSTKDIDAVFAPKSEIEFAAEAVANRYSLPKDWLNDAVSKFLADHKKQVWFNFSNLKVYIPTADYLLAMKALAAREYASDRADLKRLIDHLNLQTPTQVFEILKSYYPNNEIKFATQMMIEEIFDALDEHD